MRILRLFWTFTRIGILNELQYRVNFFVQLFQSLLALGTSIVALALVFQHTTTLNGWSQYELLMVMGIHVFVLGLIKMFIQPNMQRLMTDVQEGTLDYLLTKPADSQVLVSIREVQLWRAVDILTGIGLLITAGVLLGRSIGWDDALMFVVALILGASMIYHVWLMLTTTAFWILRADDIIEMFESLYQTGRWPVGIYPGWLRGVLTFVLPVAFAVTVPAEALTSRLSGNTLLLAFGLSIALAVITRIVWRIGVRNYSGASA